MNHMTFDEWIRVNYPVMESEYYDWDGDDYCPKCFGDGCRHCDDRGLLFFYKKAQEYRGCLLKDEGLLAKVDKGFGDLPLFR